MFHPLLPVSLWQQKFCGAIFPEIPFETIQMTSTMVITPQLNIKYMNVEV